MIWIPRTVFWMQVFCHVFVLGRIKQNEAFHNKLSKSLSKANTIKGTVILMKKETISSNEVTTPGYEERRDVLQDTWASGQQVALGHCQKQFRWEKWNCPEYEFTRLRTSKMTTRETAYVTAMTSAGVVYGVARNCSRGDDDACGCGGSPSVATSIQPASKKNTGVQWSWGGCNDHVDHGEHVVNMLMTSSKGGVDAYTYTARHNSRVGQQVVRNSVRRQCRCHGVSGSCSIRTCWLQLGVFQDIGAVLKRRYHKAIRADLVTEKGELYPGNVDTPSQSHLSHPSRPEVQNFVRHTTDSLIFIADSPDHCRANYTTGWPGTRGRLCSKRRGAPGRGVDERRSCRTLCHACGYRVVRKRRPVLSHCNCVFSWCCQVKCEVCTLSVDEFYCQ